MCNSFSTEEKVSVEFTESEARELITAFKKARVFQWKLQDALKDLDDKRYARLTMRNWSA